MASFPFARRYLGNRCFFLFLGLLRCFSSPRFLIPCYFIHTAVPAHYCRWVPPFGNLRFITDICSLPQLIAACHVLLRLLVPRHSPYALFNLTCCSSFYRPASLLSPASVLTCPEHAPLLAPSAPCSSIKILRSFKFSSLPALTESKIIVKTLSENFFSGFSVEASSGSFPVKASEIVVLNPLSANLLTCLVFLVSLPGYRLILFSISFVFDFCFTQMLFSFQCAITILLDGGLGRTRTSDLTLIRRAL